MRLTLVRGTLSRWADVGICPKWGQGYVGWLKMSLRPASGFSPISSMAAAIASRCASSIGCWPVSLREPHRIAVTKHPVRNDSCPLM